MYHTLFKKFTVHHHRPIQKVSIKVRCIVVTITLQNNTISTFVFQEANLKRVTIK